MRAEKNLDALAQSICKQLGYLKWEALSEEGVAHYRRLAERKMVGFNSRKIMRIQRVLATELFPETQLRRIAEIASEEIKL